MHFSSFFVTLPGFWYPDGEREARTAYSVEDTSIARIYVAAPWCLLFCSLLVFKSREQNFFYRHYYFFTDTVFLSTSITSQRYFFWVVLVILEPIIFCTELLLLFLIYITWYCTEFHLPVYCPVIQHHEHCLQLFAENCEFNNLSSSNFVMVLFHPSAPSIYWAAQALRENFVRLPGNFQENQLYIQKF